jgi:hypothetical protein
MVATSAPTVRVERGDRAFSCGDSGSSVSLTGVWSSGTSSTGASWTEA